MVVADSFKPRARPVDHPGGMQIDLSKARAFMATHARLIDRRRLDLHTGRGRADDVLTALTAYQNADGGYGWALEPDLRAPGSQPVGALHAFEVLEEVGPVGGPCAVRLCDWLASVTLPDGGLPFALPIADVDAAGCAPFWRQADPSRSSLHATAMVAAVAHHAARHEPGVRDHAWLARATDHCRRRIEELDVPRGAHEFCFVLQFLDAAHDAFPGAVAELERLGEHLPGSGTLAVEGGAEGEALRPLDISPLPGRPLRELFAADVIAADLDRLAAEQQDDGGWSVDFVSHSAAGALEWRGYATVRAVTILRAHQAV
jgi:hypothetical protein